MKGIVFCEFVEMMEAEFSAEMADEIISSTELESGGAYTAVGTYDHNEMLALVTQLSEKTGAPVPDLVEASDATCSVALSNCTRPFSSVSMAPSVFSIASRSMCMLRCASSIRMPSCRPLPLAGRMTTPWSWSTSRRAPLRISRVA